MFVSPRHRRHPGPPGKGAALPACVAVLLLGLSAPVAAVETTPERLSFDIPAQPLAPALNAFGAATQLSSD